MFTLRFDLADVQTIAGRYDYASDVAVEAETAPFMRANGYLTKPLFLKLCRWKSPRTQPRCASNDEAFVEAVTRTALGTENERLRIEVLTLLRGVSCPTASVILHFGSRDPYPILDYRALWSLGIDRPPAYGFDFWWAYTRFCRPQAQASGVSMRTLDQALWQYSAEH